MKHGTTYVGLDVHKDSIAVAGLFPGHREVREMRVANEGQALRRLARQLRRQGKSEVICCYEAGMCGYAVQRALQTTGVTCKVVAPSLVPRKPGERIKTDRRDARKLAELLRAGLLTEVHPPTPEEEAVRDLCRAREDAQQDLVRSRHRLDKKDPSVVIVTPTGGTPSYLLNQIVHADYNCSDDFHLEANSAVAGDLIEPNGVENGSKSCQKACRD